MLSEKCKKKLTDKISGCDAHIVRHVLSNISNTRCAELEKTQPLLYGKHTPVRGENIGLLYYNSLNISNGLYTTKEEDLSHISERLAEVNMSDDSSEFIVTQELDYLTDTNDLQYEEDDLDDPRDYELIKESLAISDEIKVASSSTISLTQEVHMPTLKKFDTDMFKSCVDSVGAMSRTYSKILPVYYNLIYDWIKKEMPDLPMIEEKLTHLIWSISTHIFTKKEEYFFGLLLFNIFTKKIETQMCFYPWTREKLKCEWCVKMRKKEPVIVIKNEYRKLCEYDVSEGYITELKLLDTRKGFIKRIRSDITEDIITHLYVSSNYIFQLPEGMPHLIELDCSYNLISEIYHYPSLQRLNISGNPIEKINLKPDQLVSLTADDVTSTSTNIDHIMKFVSTCHNLNYLSCRYNTISDINLSSKLTELNIEYCELTKNVHLPKLNYVKMSGCKAPNIYVAFSDTDKITCNGSSIHKIIFNGHVHFADLSNSGVNEVDINHKCDEIIICNSGVKKFKCDVQVELLNLNGNRIKNLELTAPSFPILHLDHCGYTADDLPRINADFVHCLTLNDNDFSLGFDFNKLSLKKVDTIYLENCNISKVDPSLVARSIHLSGNNIRKIPKLQYNFIGKLVLTKNPIDTFIKIKHTTKIYLDENIHIPKNSHTYFHYKKRYFDEEYMKMECSEI